MQNLHRSFGRFLVRSVTAVGFILLAACASQGYQKADKASDSLTRAADEIDVARHQIVETTSALIALTTQLSGDLRTAYNRYSASLKDLDDTVVTVGERAGQMNEQGGAYFTVWDAQLAEIHSDEIREQSQARRRELNGRFAEIRQRYQDARREFVPLMTTFHDIQKLLSADLTPAGVSGAAKFAERAAADGATVRKTLDALSDDFRAFSINLKSEAPSIDGAPPRP